MPPPPGGAELHGLPDDGEPAPSLFTAVQEQLGLKLESRKAAIDLVIVDHVEKTPSEN